MYLKIKIFLFVFVCALHSVAAEKVFESVFQTPKLKKVYKGAYEYLKENGIAPTELEKHPLPADWSIEWILFPADGKFKCTDHGFYVESLSGKIIITGPVTNFHGQKVNMLLTLTNPAEEEAYIELGVHEYGMLNPGAHIMEKAVINSGESKTISLQFTSDQKYAVALPRIAVHGKIVLQKFEILSETEPGLTVLEGEILERSELPDPKKSDYPDCRFTIHFKGNSIFSGTSCKEELALVVDGFKNYHRLNTDDLKAGDKILCAIMPFDELPEESRSTQQADDLNLFMLDCYYIMSITRISNFSDVKNYPRSGIFFNDATENYISVFERQINQPVSERLREAQQKQIAEDLAEMNRLLEGWETRKDELNRQFALAWTTEQTKDAPGL